ncbi:retrovirus-related pol polyprotein from transposon TNT 1-94 [Tanacetum coccineum]
MFYRRIKIWSTSVSTTFAQDAPLTSYSPSSSGIQPPVIHHDVAVGPTIEDTLITKATLHPSVNPVTGEPGSAQSSSGDASIAEPNQANQPPAHLRKWSKDHPLDNIVGNPSRPELVPRPVYVMVIALKWIYKVKLDEHGDVLKNKARLVAKGYRQEEGINFEESFVVMDYEMLRRINKVHKFSDGTLTRIKEKLDFMVKDFKLFKFNKGMENRKWSKDDKRRSEDFIEVIEKRLKIRRIFRSLESFIGGRLRDIDYRLISRTLRRTVPKDRPCILLNWSYKVGKDTYPILLSFTHCGNKSILRVLRIILVILPEHPSETMVFHNEDGNPARANIKQALGYLKDGDGDGNSQLLRFQMNNRMLRHNLHFSQDGDQLQDDVRLCLGDDLKKAQDHNQRQV